MPASWQTTMTTYGLHVLQLSVWLVLLAAVFVPLERLFALRPSKLFRKSLWADLGFYFLSSLLPGVMLGVPLAAAATLAHRYLPWPIQHGIAQAPLWLRIALGLFVGEMGAYWGHRWTHQVPFLWQFHEVHHEAEHMDWLVNTRAHPVDMVFVRLCTLVPLYVLGLGGPIGAAGSVVPSIVLIIGAAWGFFVHANVRWRFGHAEMVVATPAFHHWHHVMSGPINRNYAPMFPIIDRMFGTLHLPRGEWPEAYGVLPPDSAPAKPRAPTVSGPSAEAPQSR